MIFRQLFDPVSSTYTYILASRKGGEALIIDPVLGKVDRYIQLFEELDIKLVKAIDTYLHADQGYRGVLQARPVTPGSRRAALAAPKVHKEENPSVQSRLRGT